MPEPLRLVYCWLLAAAAWPRPAAACDAGQRPDGAGGCEDCPEPGWTSVLGGWAPLLAAHPGPMNPCSGPRQQLAVGNPYVTAPSLGLGG
jgi:hypothetical protein